MAEWDRREWDRRDYQARRAFAVQYLGGRCVRCGTSDNLEFDHIDATRKSYTISQHLNRRWTVLVLELDKCQLLCSRCHTTKSREYKDYGGGSNRWDGLTHGKAWVYSKYGCRCEPCRCAAAIAKGRPAPRPLSSVD